jgi:hypothetical protein
MTPLDWLALVHPVLMILFVYPVVGATIRLGILVRERRLGIHPLPPTVGEEHTAHGRWLTSAVVLLVLIALAVVLLGAPGGLGLLVAAPRRLGGLLLLVAVAMGGVLALWRPQRSSARALLSLLAWGALLILVAQPEVRQLGSNPFGGLGWGSHALSGVLLCGLLLFSMAAAPDTLRWPRMRRLHQLAGLVTGLLLAVQAITGARDLLALPLRR